jgi:ankyrin repeat protein
LLQKGADAQPRNGEGNTPLHLAAQRSDVEFVRLLLEAGADRLVKNHKGQLPVHLASEGARESEERQRKVVDLLEPQFGHQR